MKVNFTKEMLYPENIGNGTFTEKEKRAIYRQLWKTTKRRLERIGKTEFRKTGFYQHYAGTIPSVSTFRTEAQLNKALSRLSAAYYSGEGTLTKMRRKRAKDIETLRAHGFMGVTKANYFEFIEYMETIRARQLENTFYSVEDSEKLFEVAQKKGIDPKELLDDISFFAGNIEDLQGIKKKDIRPGMSSDELKSLINKCKRKK